MSRLLIGIFAAIAISAFAAQDANAGSRSLNRDVTDSIGRISSFGPEAALDDGYLYWTEPLTAGSAGKADQLMQLDVATGKVRVLTTVHLGVVGSVAADFGRVGFTTHRRARSSQRGRVVETESAIYSMAATDEVPALLGTSTATSRFELRKRKNRRAWRTAHLHTCGGLPSVQDISETGQLLTLTRTMVCDRLGTDAEGEFFVYEPGAAIPASLGRAEAQFTGLLQQNHLIDMGNLNLDTGDRRPSSVELSTSARTRYSTSGFTLDLTGGPGGHFAATVYQSRSTRFRGKKFDLETHLIFLLGTAKPLTAVDYFPAGEISRIVLCQDAFVQIREFPAVYRSRLVFRDYNGKVLRTIKGPRGSDVPIAAKCTGRTLSLAIYNNADADFDQFPYSVRRYEF